MKKILLSAAMAACFSVAQAQEVTTWAGTGTAGYSAPGTSKASAKFDKPYGVAVTSKGEVYVSDYNNHYIVLIDTLDRYQFRAGKIGGGFLDGTSVGNNAFGYPAGIAVGAGDTLYIADMGNNAIRRLHPYTGNPVQPVITIAGGGEHGKNGEEGYLDGVGMEARFSQPHGIAVAKDGSLIVTDLGNHVIRRITLDGKVTTIAGQAGVAGVDDGASTAATFTAPMSIWIDKSGPGQYGDIYIGEQTGNVRKISNGQVTTASDGLPGIHAILGVEEEIYASLGCLLVTSSTDYEPYSGDFEDCNHADGTIDNARFNGVTGMAHLVDGSRNYILLADGDNNRIRRISLPVTVGIAEKASALVVKIYPNPAKNTVTVTLPEPTEEKAVITLTDMAGRVVLSQMVHKNFNQFPIAVDGLTNGVYMLKVETAKAASVQKLMISK